MPSRSPAEYAMMRPSRSTMSSTPLPSAISNAFRSLTGRLVRAMAHTSPVRLLLLICVSIGVTHAAVMLSIHRHTAFPLIAQSVIESAVLVFVLFPALYFFSFRPLIAQFREREQAETIMRESEHKYRHLFDSLGDAAFLFDLESGRVIDANQQAEKLLGRPRAEILGKTHGFCSRPKKPTSIARGCCRAGPRQRQPALKPRRKPGTAGACRCMSAPHRSRSSATIWSSVSFGILPNSKPSTPNCSMHNGSKASEHSRAGLRTTSTTPLRPSCLPRICSAPNRLARVLRTCWTLSAVALRAPRRSCARCSPLCAVVQTSGPMCSSVTSCAKPPTWPASPFPNRSRSMRACPSDLWTVKADSAQLSQVLMNLAVNARDAMPDGGELRFSAEKLAVADTGPQSVPD